MTPRPMIRDEAIYIAGLFDGEGYVNVSETKRNRDSDHSIFMFCVGITNTNLAILEWLSEFGGTVHKKSKGKDYWSQAYEWRATGNIAQAFLTQIEPFCRIKRELVVQALIYRRKWGWRRTQAYDDHDLVRRRADREKVVCLVNRRNKPS